VVYNRESSIEQAITRAALRRRAVAAPAVSLRAVLDSVLGSCWSRLSRCDGSLSSAAGLVESLVATPRWWVETLPTS
jgi:hypothetical protein